MAASDLRLASGRVVRLWRLDQVKTYAGLMEGLPTRETNSRRLEALRTRLTAQIGPRGLHVIEPVEAPIAMATPYPFGAPARLPAIEVTAWFECGEPAKDPTRDCSSLTVVWFQAEYVFPVEPSILEQLVQLDWDTLAVDGDY